MYIFLRSGVKTHEMKFQRPFQKDVPTYPRSSWAGVLVSAVNASIYIAVPLPPPPPTSREVYIVARR